MIFVFLAFFFLGQIKTSAVFDVESKPHYWLTIYAQDHGVVPLSSRLEVSFLCLNLLIYSSSLYFSVFFFLFCVIQIISNLFYFHLYFCFPCVVDSHSRVLLVPNNISALKFFFFFTFRLVSVISIYSAFLWLNFLFFFFLLTRPLISFLFSLYLRLFVLFIFHLKSGFTWLVSFGSLHFRLQFFLL